MGHIALEEYYAGGPPGGREAISKADTWTSGGRPLMSGRIPNVMYSGATL